MLNQFLNSLSATRNHRFAGGHRLQVHASQALVPTGQRKYGAASHGLCYFGPSLPADKLNSLCNAQIPRQRLKSAALRPFSDDAASQLGKGKLEPPERSQDQFVAFAGQQIADDKNLRMEWFHLIWIRRKKNWICAVVHDGAAGRRSGFQDLLHLAADTYYCPRRTIDIHRDLPPPHRRNPP